MNCPQCRGTLAQADARCAHCGFVLASESQPGVPAWVWVAAIAGALLLLLGGGCVALRIFVGRTHSLSAVSSVSIQAGALDEGASALEQALVRFTQEHGVPPAQLADLVGARTASGAHVLAMDQLPLDTYGRPYFYALESTADSWSLSVTSLGRDGLPGGGGEDQDSEVLAMRGQRR